MPCAVPARAAPAHEAGARYQCAGFRVSLARHTPGQLIELAAEKEIKLFTSRALLDELAATLAKKKLAKPVAATGLSAGQMLRNYRRVATLVTARRLAQQVSRESDDDAVLACALAADVDLIASGDDDLPVLKHFHDIPNVTPAEAIKLIS